MKKYLAIYYNLVDDCPVTRTIYSNSDSDALAQANKYLGEMKNIDRDFELYKDVPKFGTDDFGEELNRLIKLCELYVKKCDLEIESAVKNGDYNRAYYLSVVKTAYESVIMMKKDKTFYDKILDLWGI